VARNDNWTSPELNIYEQGLIDGAAEAEVEVEYWKDQLSKAVGYLSGTGHVYEFTGARHPSPRERKRVIQFFDDQKRREAAHGDE